MSFKSILFAAVIGLSGPLSDSMAQAPAEESLEKRRLEEVTNEHLITDSLVDEVETTPLPLDQIKTFAEVFTRIKRNYVTPVADETLIDYAIKGMLNGLDPHSAYLKDESVNELDEATTGRFGGLGLEVVMEDGYLKVVAPIDDTPADRAGILTGDIIIKIDGKAISGNSLREATAQMRGKPGTLIKLTILRETEPDPVELELERAIVRVSSIIQRELSEQIGYLRISQFQTSTAESFRKKLKALRDKERFAGLVIDLRNNPGGLLNSAVSIADTFINNGLIVTTKGRHQQDEQQFRATPTDMISGKPIVVLINGGSASASEIVAGALQDHHRAIILGTQSFGKGSVQTVVSIGETQAIKLTTARYYTPNGRSIQAAGIAPDVVVHSRKFSEQRKGHDRIKENDLPRHLENESMPAVNKKAQEIDKILAADYQLNEAYNLLKGLVLYQKTNEEPSTLSQQ
jgi:carboxyl-terminal processing protease